MPAHRSDRYQRIKAAQRDIDAAATLIRKAAIGEQYAGFQKPELAFCVAAILDDLSRCATDLHGTVLNAVVGECRQLLRWAHAQPGDTIDGIGSARRALDQT